jgi:hypothetical protein
VKVHRLSDMKRGWFVGDFEPTLYATGAVEVAVKEYVAGDSEELDLHKVATELTAVISGDVRMGGRQLAAGDIAVLEPGEASDFLALTDSTVVAVKLPGAPDDKYLVEA